MPPVNQKKIIELRQNANRIRQLVISMLAEAGSGHPGGALGMADVFAALYFHVLKHDPKRPDWPGRDRLILSNGHICPARYAAMTLTGYFPELELLTLRRLGSRLQGHPERERLPGLESTSGPLGAGLAQAAGLALAAKMDKKTWTTYCLTSDGEHDSGLHWEAVLFAGANDLNNLICVVDRNRIQLDGETETIMRLEPLREKYLAFNWDVIEVDGHDLPKIIEALETAKSSRQRPTAIIAMTTLGKGVEFMENNYHWHGEAPTREQAKQALAELRKEAAGPPQAKPTPGPDVI